MPTNDLRQSAHLWLRTGAWERIFEDPRLEPDNHYLMFDNFVVCVHQRAASGKGGGEQKQGFGPTQPVECQGRGSRGGLTTKPDPY